MHTPIITPYGFFKTINAAAMHIERHHAPEFIKQHSEYSFPYDHIKMGHYGKGTNNSSRHYIYHVIQQQIGSATSGRRQPKSGWARMPKSSLSSPAITWVA
jgi:hypothetical protein